MRHRSPKSGIAEKEEIEHGNLYEQKAYMYGTGRRKSSVARVHLFPNGTGSITVNGRPSMTTLVSRP